jgi:rhodanese-related sulfurtransferase
VNIPHDVLEQHLGEISRDHGQEVVVYCEKGGRAAKAAAVLTAAGFTSVRHLTGDMAAWREAGLPIAK